MSRVGDEAEDLSRVGRAALEELSAFADALTGGQPSSQTAKKLLFVIDEATKVLENLRIRLTDPPGNREEARAEPKTASRGLMDALRLILAKVLAEPETFARHYGAFAKAALEALAGRGDLAPDDGDFRFKDPLWHDSPFYRALLQIYLAWRQSMQGWLDAQVLEAVDRRRVEFIFKQIIAAFSPSNLPLQPTAVKRASQTEGESAVKGLLHWVEDLVANKGMPRQVRPDAYRVGDNLATTRGAVVFRNDQLELIQYAPQTEAVRGRPVLLIPPQINKFYIFDLKPKNSMLGHLVKAGLQMFVLSWRNPSANEREWGLDLYTKAALEALSAISAITRTKTLGIISACAGGLTAMALMGYLAARREPRVVHHSLLVTSLFAGHGSDMELFVTPDVIERARRYSGALGLMPGDELSKIFFWLRPDDLVWRYWINNYLLGKEPPSLDVLFWDNDSTMLPARLHGEFIDMFVNDVFNTAGALEILREPIDFDDMNVDGYYVGGDEDYLMPWRGCYRAYQRFRGHNRFVLSTGGHVQSILRPPRIANTAYFINERSAPSPEDWLSHATRFEGSWWGDWHKWLQARSGPLRAAPTQLGSADYPILDRAPGEYVK
jgi:polyhydroxyalkanoate synthase